MVAPAQGNQLDNLLMITSKNDALGQSMQTAVVIAIAPAKRFIKQTILGWNDLFEIRNKVSVQQNQIRLSLGLGYSNNFMTRFTPLVVRVISVI